MAKKLKKGFVGLPAIVAATQASADGFVFTLPAEHKELGDLVVINANVKDAEGKIATRASEKGIAQVQSAGAEAQIEGTPAAEPVAKPSYEIEAGIPLPKPANRGRTSG